MLGLSKRRMIFIGLLIAFYLIVGGTGYYYGGPISRYLKKREMVAELNQCEEVLSKEKKTATRYEVEYLTKGGERMTRIVHLTWKCGNIGIHK